MLVHHKVTAAGSTKKYTAARKAIIPKDQSILIPRGTLGNNQHTSARLEAFY